MKNHPGLESKFAWVRYICDRLLNRNKNFLGMITGQTGSGKSWTALSIAEMVDPEFDETRVIFRASELLELINSGNLKKGSCIIWDEAGIDMSNRNWQSQLNKTMNYLFQTFRHRNFCLIFTAPYGDFIDTATRKLFHAEFETDGINRTEGTCGIKPKMLQYNPELKKWYKKYLKVIKPGVGMIKIRRWAVPKPSSELVQKYERLKNKFTNELNMDLEQTLNEIKAKSKTEPRGETQRAVLKVWEEQGVFKQKDIAELLGKDPSMISQSIAGLRKQGYFVENYKEMWENKKN